MVVLLKTRFEQTAVTVVSNNQSPLFVVQNRYRTANLFSPSKKRSQSMRRNNNYTNNIKHDLFYIFFFCVLI